MIGELTWGVHSARIGRSSGAVARFDPRELGADPVLDCHCAQSRSADAADVSVVVRLTSPVATGADTMSSVRPMNPAHPVTRTWLNT